MDAKEVLEDEKGSVHRIHDSLIEHQQRADAAAGASLNFASLSRAWD
jgi:hypothetical protein